MRHHHFDLSRLISLLFSLCLVCLWCAQAAQAQCSRPSFSQQTLTNIGNNFFSIYSADYNRDGKTDFIVAGISTRIYPGDGMGGASNIWYVLRSSDNSFVAQAWGLDTDKAVQGDYDGDAKADVAVYRESNGVWFVLKSTDNSLRTFQLSTTFGFYPVPGNYDGDGKFDAGVYSRGLNTLDPMRWNYSYSSSNTIIEGVFFGNGFADNPVPAAFIP